MPEGTPIEIWFQDEARIGQKNGLVRQWARHGTRPRQPADQRYENAYLFGAICPARGEGAALALPFADTEAMQLHLEEIAANVAAGAHVGLGGLLHERAKAHHLVGHRWFLGCVGVSQPDPTGESPVTTASRSLATALLKARFASGLLPPRYTTPGGTTLPTPRWMPNGRDEIERRRHRGGTIGQPNRAFPYST